MQALSDMTKTGTGQNYCKEKSIVRLFDTVLWLATKCKKNIWVKTITHKFVSQLVLCKNAYFLEQRNEGFFSSSDYPDCSLSSYEIHDIY